MLDPSSVSELLLRKYSIERILNLKGYIINSVIIFHSHISLGDIGVTCLPSEPVTARSIVIKPGGYFGARLKIQGPLRSFGLID